MSDADCSTPFSEWPRLAAVLKNGADLAVGSRQAPGAEIEIHQPWLRQRLGMMFGRLARSVFPLGVIDSQCGFKGFKAAAARSIFSGLAARGYAFDIEVLLKARRLGYRLVEVPVHWKNHPDSRVRVWRDWPRVLRELWLIHRELRAGGGRKDPG
jgi:dolichyl-phosphate beta-glucosyltransferase